MYRILLADDEGIMLESLKKIIIKLNMEMNVKSTVQSQAELWWRWHRHIRRISVLWISRCRE